jgi:surface protein
MKQNILLIISSVIFIAAILTSGAMTNWWQGESRNVQPMPTPTAAPTVAPKPTPKPKAAFQNLSDLKSAVSAYFNKPSQIWNAIGDNENLKNHNVNTDTTYYEYYGPIEDWNTSQVTDMSSLFKDCENFNGNISKWNTSQVTNMSDMFRNTRIFNADISKWNTSQVTNMLGMFYGAWKFNQDINTKTVTLDNGTIYTAWDVSNVQNMKSMLSETRAFNQDLNKWNTSKVIGTSSGGMQTMFLNAKEFNGDISNWNVTNVKNMKGMFSGASKFNGDISSWIPSNCDYFGFMFYNATSFNRNLSSWTTHIPQSADPNDGNDGIFTGATLMPSNYKFTVT